MALLEIKINADPMVVEIGDHGARRWDSDGGRSGAW
jgi:hypothetical protein